MRARAALLDVGASQAPRRDALRRARGARWTRTATSRSRRIPTPPSGRCTSSASPADPRTTPSPPSSTPARSVTSPAFASAPPRVTSTSATSAPTATATATPVGDRTTHPPHPPVPRRFPAATSGNPVCPPRRRRGARASRRPRPTSRSGHPRTTTPRSLASPSPSLRRRRGFPGFASAPGGEATFASESCPHARRTYVVNHGCGAGTGAPGDGPLVVGDITDVCEEIIPPHDVLTGGFPVPIVQRGANAGDWTIREARSTARYSGTLVACRPRAFLLENVEGLATMDDGEVLDVIVADLRAAGYDVETKIIDAGVGPQEPKARPSSAPPLRRRRRRRNVRRPWTTTAGLRAPRADLGRARRVGFVGRRGSRDARRDGEGRVGG